MKFSRWMVFGLFASSAGCVAEKGPRDVATRPPVPAWSAHPVVDPAAPVAAFGPMPGVGKAAAPARVNTVVDGISLEGVTFDSRTHRLIVADQEKGPGSRWTDARAAGQAYGGLSAINAGFFTPEGAPLGLVMTGGAGRGAWNGASFLGAGVWYEDAAGNIGIARREKIGRAGASKMKELLQAGPFLVEGGASVSGLNAEKSTARSILIWDGGTRWMMARTSSCTLAGLSAALAAGSPAGWKTDISLNLDGGSSSELWAANTVSGGGIFTRPFWNKPVRNYLVLKPRP